MKQLNPKTWPQNFFNINSEDVFKMREASLYVHVPFCTRKCDYCNFFSMSHCSEELKEDIIEATITQLQFFYDSFSCPRIKSLYIGGGTPSTLKPSLLEKLLKVTNRLCTNNVEKTIEANPESIDNAWLDVIKEYNINRLSIGVQSFQKQILTTIGRFKNSERIYNTLTWIKENWENDINIDMLIHVPNQTQHLLWEDIKTLCYFNPDHISLYSLTLEPETTMTKKIMKHGYNNKTNTSALSVYPLYNEVKVENEVIEYLDQLGYKRYEISNFSQPGKASDHNIGYWEMEPYIGVGPGSVSTLIFDSFNTPADIFSLKLNHKYARLTTTRDFNTFLQGEHHAWGLQKENLSPKQFFFEHLMMGFRLLRGLNRNILNKRFGPGWEAGIANTLTKWNNVLNQDDDYIALNPDGLLLLNKFLLDCALEIDL